MWVALYFLCGLIGGYIAVKMDHPYEKITRGKLVMIIFIGLFGYITLAIVLFILLIIFIIEMSESTWGNKKL